MLVSNWAQNYWAVSTVAKKNLYEHKNIIGLAPKQSSNTKAIGLAYLRAIQKLELMTDPNGQCVIYILFCALCQEAKTSQGPSHT
jgi:hypothetical protein